MFSGYQENHMVQKDWVEDKIEDAIQFFDSKPKECLPHESL